MVRSQDNNDYSRCWYREMKKSKPLKFLSDEQKKKKFNILFAWHQGDKLIFQAQVRPKLGPI